MSFTDPLELFRTALFSLRDGDFLGAARCCDPVSLRVYQKGLVEQYSDAKPFVAVTAEQLLSSDPTRSRDVVESMLSRHAATLAHHGDVSRNLPGISSLDELRANHACSIVMCRRQPDGGWLLLAESDFLGATGGYFIGYDDDSDDK